MPTAPKTPKARTAPVAIFRPIAADYRRYDGAEIVSLQPSRARSWCGSLVDVVLASGDKLTAYAEEIEQPAPQQPRSPQGRQSPRRAPKEQR